MEGALLTNATLLLRSRSFRAFIRGFFTIRIFLVRFSDTQKQETAAKNSEWFRHYSLYPPARLQCSKVVVHEDFERLTTK